MVMQEFVVGLKYGVQMELVHKIATFLPSKLNKKMNSVVLV
jgi:hypothetical protein